MTTRVEEITVPRVRKFKIELTEEEIRLLAHITACGQISNCSRQKDAERFARELNKEINNSTVAV